MIKRDQGGGLECIEWDDAIEEKGCVSPIPRSFMRFVPFDGGILCVGESLVEGVEVVGGGCEGV